MPIAKRRRRSRLSRRGKRWGRRWIKVENGKSEEKGVEGGEVK